jgi:hypothetical protein
MDSTQDSVLNSLIFERDELSEMLEQWDEKEKPQGMLERLKELNERIERLEA